MALPQCLLAFAVWLVPPLMDISDTYKWYYTSELLAIWANEEARAESLLDDANDEIHRANNHPGYM